MKGLHRLIALERAAANTKSVSDSRQSDTTEQAEIEARWAIMRQTMSEEHAGLVLNAFQAGLHRVTNDGFNTPASRLLQRCLDGLWRSERHWPHSEIPPEVYLAMPPEVAEVYLAHPEALPLHDCEDCGYKLPHGFFEKCPLCSGRVGFSAFFLKRQQSRRSTVGV